MSKVRDAAFAVTVAYVWVTMVMLGALILETFMVYPNIFHDPPDSLILAQEFMSVSAPNTLFRPLGMLLIGSGAAALALGWTVRTARIWIALSVLMIVADGMASMVLFWPRNEIMFVEGLTMHTAEELRRVAQEFVALHWIRLVLNVASAAFGFTGLFAFARWRFDQRARAGLARLPMTLSPSQFA